MTPGHWVIGSQTSEASALSPNAESYRRRTDTTSTQLLKPKNSQDMVLLARSFHSIPFRFVQLGAVCTGLNAVAVLVWPTARPDDLSLKSLARGQGMLGSCLPSIRWFTKYVNEKATGSSTNIKQQIGGHVQDTRFCFLRPDEGEDFHIRDVPVSNIRPEIRSSHRSRFPSPKCWGGAVKQVKSTFVSFPIYSRSL